MRRVLVFALVLCSACSSSERGGDERTGEARSAIFGGRVSGDADNAAVYIETGTPESLLRCSGLLLAPRLVMAARHCFLKRRSANVRCNADGSPVDITEQTDLTVEQPERITVFVGSVKPDLRAVKVIQALAPIDGSVCGSDIAFLVLSEPSLDVRTPLRRAAVRIGEEISVSGWGFTNDDTRTAANLPTTRFTLDKVPVQEVGPGFIPPGTFAIGGNTLCLGDSGAVARIDGAAVGVYSRIDGDSNKCGFEFTRNVLQGVASQPLLVTKAFAAIGETPLYADDPVDAGVTIEPPPATPSSDAGAPAAPPSESSCSSAPGRTEGAPSLVALAVVALVMRRRRSSRAR